MSVRSISGMPFLPISPRFVPLCSEIESVSPMHTPRISISSSTCMAKTQRKSSTWAASGRKGGLWQKGPTPSDAAW